ncbi:MAG: HpaII family restriction endonuclease [Bacteroidaceae bacterium]|nr:HpaII family restriction endonuclease [Bacteroidaceae bacterium]
MKSLSKTNSCYKNKLRHGVYEFHDADIDFDNDLPYYIKSNCNFKYALFNANKDGTNFLFKVKGELSATEIEAFNGIKLFKDKFAYLKEHGCTLEFNDVVNPTFNCNLTLIDSDLKRILAECLLVYYSHQANAMVDVGEIVSKTNPCRYPEVYSIDFYAYKLKQFLIITALGMTANTPWDGQYQANGGYIVVKEDGDVVCFHFIDRNQLEDYLYHNTAFDTPSTSRHAFGYIYEDGGELWMKLNMQIRFIHDN